MITRRRNAFSPIPERKRTMSHMFRTAVRYGDARAREAEHLYGELFNAKRYARLHWWSMGWYRLMLNRRGHEFLAQREAAAIDKLMEALK